jgi:hypothetical protein
MKVRIQPFSALTDAVSPAVPLWQLAPTHDAGGHLLTDFMMLIPRLRTRPPMEIERASRDIQAVLALHQDVVFADLN